MLSCSGEKTGSISDNAINFSHIAYELIINIMISFHVDYFSQICFYL